MNRTALDIATTEFEDEVPDIAAKEELYARQVFDGMRLLRLSEKLFTLKTIDVDLKNGMAKLPDDFYKEWNGDTSVEGPVYGQAVEYGNGVTFDISSCVLKSNLSSGKVEFSYFAIPTDEKGFPIVTEQHGIDIAMAYYLRYRHTKAMYQAGKVGVDRKREAKRDWTEIAADVRGDAKMPDPARLQRILNRYRMRKRY